MSYILNLQDNTKKKPSTNSLLTTNLIISDLDKFYNEIYEYYYNGGYRNIFTQCLLDNLTYIFTIHFLLFNIFCIEWHHIISDCHLSDSQCQIDLTNYISTRLLYEHFLTFLFLYLLLIIYYLLFLYSSITHIISMKKIHHIYHHKLHLKTKDLENKSFDDIMNSLINLQHLENFCRVKEVITKYDIIARISRKDNYLNAIISSSVIDISITLPFIGRISLLTNYVYNTMTNSIMSIAFRKGEVDISPSLYNYTMIQVKMMWCLLFQLLSLPCEVIFRVVFWLFKNVDNIRSSRGFVSKTWAYEEMIRFRNYNELQHHFDSRLNEACVYTDDFLKCFKQKIVSIVGKAMILIGGSILFIVFIISMIDIKLSYMTIYGKSYLWLLCFIGIIVSWFNHHENARERIYSQIENYPIKKKCFSRMINCLVNIPREWSCVNITKNFRQISIAYYGNVLAVVKELVSVCLFPLIWLKIMVQMKEMIKFIKQTSMKIDGIGTVCSLSVLSAGTYMSVKEKGIIYGSEQVHVNDVKWINSMIYYEKYFIDGRETLIAENDYDDGDNDGIAESEMIDIGDVGNELIALTQGMSNIEGINEQETKRNKLDEIQQEKTKEIRMMTLDIIYQMIRDKGNEYSNVPLDAVKKMIFYYCSLVNHSDVLMQMNKEKLNYTTFN